MSKGGGGSSGTTQTQTVTKADPWSEQQPYLKQGFQQAQEIYNQGAPGYYPGQTVAPFSPETNAAMEAQTNRALAGSPLMTAAQQQLTDTMSGKYLDVNTNPYLMPLADQIRANVQPGIEGRFAGSGRLNSGLASRAVGQGVTDALATQAYQNYNDERTRQTQGMMFAPSLANADYNDISKLADVGAQREGMAQAQTNADIAKYNYEANLPNNWLSQYMNIIQGQYGGSGTSTQSQPYYQNRLASGAGGALGGGLLGASSAGSLGIDPAIAALMGAGGGGLLGYFG